MDIKKYISEEVTKLYKGIMSEAELNELSPELLQRAATAASGQAGREAQTNNLQQGAVVAKQKAADNAQTQLLAPVESFIGQSLEIVCSQGKNSDVSAYVIKYFKMPTKDTLWIYVQLSDTEASMLKYNFSADKFEWRQNATGFLSMSLNAKYNVGNIRVDNISVTQKTAQLLWKIAKSINPETKTNPNTLGITVTKGAVLTPQPTTEPQSQQQPEVQPLKENANLNNFVVQEVAKLHKRVMLETELKKVERQLKSLNEEADATAEQKTYNSNVYETYRKDLEEVVKSLAEACNKLESATLKQDQHMKSLPQVEARTEEGSRNKQVILDIFKEVKRAKIAAERKLYEMS